MCLLCVVCGWGSAVPCRVPRPSTGRVSAAAEELSVITRYRLATDVIAAFEWLLEAELAVEDRLSCD